MTGKRTICADGIASPIRLVQSDKPTTTDLPRGRMLMVYPVGRLRLDHYKLAEVSLHLALATAAQGAEAA